MRIESGQVKKGEKGVKDPKLIRSITGMEESDGAERERWTSNKQTLKAKKKKSRDFLRDRASDRPISEAGDNEKNQTCWCQSGRRRGGKQAWRNSFSWMSIESIKLSDIILRRRLLDVHVESVVFGCHVAINTWSRALACLE